MGRIYDAKAAPTDAILYQMDDKNLMKKIISEDSSYDDTVQYGLAMEQGARKVEQTRGCMSGKKENCIAALEEQVRALNAKVKNIL